MECLVLCGEFGFVDGFSGEVRGKALLVVVMFLSLYVSQAFWGLPVVIVPPPSFSSTSPSFQL